MKFAMRFVLGSMLATILTGPVLAQSSTGVGGFRGNDGTKSQPGLPRGFVPYNLGNGGFGGLSNRDLQRAIGRSMGMGGGTGSRPIGPTGPRGLADPNFPSRRLSNGAIISGGIGSSPSSGLGTADEAESEMMEEMRKQFGAPHIPDIKKKEIYEEYIRLSLEAQESSSKLPRKKKDSYIQKRYEMAVSSLTKKFKLDESELQWIIDHGAEIKVSQDTRDPSWVPIRGEEALIYRGDGKPCDFAKDITTFKLRHKAIVTKDNKLREELYRTGGLCNIDNGVRVLILSVGPGIGQGEGDGAVEVRFLSGKFNGQTGIVHLFFLQQPK